MAIISGCDILGLDITLLDFPFQRASLMQDKRHPQVIDDLLIIAVRHTIRAVPRAIEENAKHFLGGGAIMLLAWLLVHEDDAGLVVRWFFVTACGAQLRFIYVALFDTFMVFLSWFRGC